MIRFVFKFSIAIVILAGCSEAFEYSPNQEYDGDSPRDLNARNAERLLTSQPDDTLTVVVTGDSQQFYGEVDRFVETVNAIEDIDLILIAGDISDFGLLQEFEWIAERLEKLRKPYFGVIGNHDLVANGEAVFKRMFGALNYSFVYDSVKFVLHNTNSREYRAPNVPDLKWLGDQLQPAPGISNFVAISHVPPFHGDFNKDLESGYAALFRNTPGFLVSLHGHVHAHSDGYPYEDGVRYITANSFEQRDFIILKIASGNVRKEIVQY